MSSFNDMMARDAAVFFDTGSMPDVETFTLRLAGESSDRTVTGPVFRGPFEELPNGMPAPELVVQIPNAAETGLTDAQARVGLIDRVVVARDRGGDTEYFGVSLVTSDPGLHTLFLT